jgi:two-component system chemotaxis response regulator CheB
MPDMDGMQTLLEIRKHYPEIAVVMVSGVSTRHAESTIRALEAGALDFIRKPDGHDIAENIELLKKDIGPILQTLSGRRGPPTPTAPPAAKPAPPPTAPPPRPSGRLPTAIDLFVIGSSTGGPNALADVIPRLPEDLGVPVLIVQHMPPMFTQSLAQHLDKKSALNVREAVDEEPVKIGDVLIAPGGRHMTVRKKSTASGQDSLIIGLTDSPPVNSCRPSVDVLFRSVAGANPGGILSLIMTGMGSDGAAGVAALKRKTCLSLAQDQLSCVVYGMSRAIVERGLADEILPLERIAARALEIIKNKTNLMK